MNKKQKAAIWIALGLFALTSARAPWTIKKRSMYSSAQVTAPIWDADAPSDYELNARILIIEWIGISVAAGALFFVLKSKH